MDVSIIFVNYKTKELTINAIKSVIEKTEGIEYEIFVVDNNSQDGSIEAIEQQFPNINIIKNKINAGFGAANNLAIKQARGKYILCLNTDTLLINNAIKIMFDFMEKEENQKVGVCGGYIYNEDMSPGACGGHLPTLKDVLWKFGLRNLFKEYYKTMCISLNSDETKYLKNIEVIIGADIFFRKSVLDKVGLFDENFFMYVEESDLCKRIINYGFTVKFVEQAKIVHLERKSNNNVLFVKKQMKIGENLYFKKHCRYKAIIVKFLYLILYLIDWLFANNKESKHLLLFLIRGYKK